MAVFIVEYRRIGYTIADAFRLDPKWGRRTFFSNSEDIGTEDIRVVKVMAMHPSAVPENYELFSIINRETREHISGKSDEVTIKP